MNGKQVNIEDELAGILGLTAETICARRFRCSSDMHRIIVKSAKIMRDNLMGAWSYSGMHIDGTTIWQSPEGGHYTRVTRGGAVDIEF